MKPVDALYLCEQIRSCEQQAFQQHLFDETELMIQAGTEAFNFIIKAYPEIRNIAVFCGSGNNAGDGYVCARLAHEYGLSVIVYQCKALEDLPPIARHCAVEALAAGVECQSADEPLDVDLELIVDALLGIGLQGPVHGVIADAIQHINSSLLPVVAIDIPSGLNADTGQVEGFCVKAEATVTFTALKPGMYTLDGPDHCGQIHCRQLDLENCIAKQTPFAHKLTRITLPLPITTRLKNTHKGVYGHVLIIGGGKGMPGAVYLAAKAALRAGAGSVTVATLPDYAKGVMPALPEAMVWGVENAQDLQPLLARATVCVIGPGLGESDWAKNLFYAAITSQMPMIIDASALRLLAQNPQVDDNWILTPHPGEAASLLECSTQDVQENRFEAAAKIQQSYGGVVVLKGVGSIIQTLDKQTFVCPKGNPGMATAGMGDVLSGIIAGLCAQGLSLSDSAKLGVWAHAVAGDKVAQSLGGAGILAQDLLPLLPNILHSV